MADDKKWRQRWQTGANLWLNRLTDSGLGGLADVSRDLFEAFRPLLLQTAWLLQPGASMLGDHDAIPSLIVLLDDPPPDSDAEGYP